MNEDILLGLAATLSAGRREVKIIERALGDLSRTDDPKSADHLVRAGLGEKIVAAVRDRMLRTAGIVVKERAEKCGVTIHLFDDESYPDRLMSLSNPPIAIFSRGELATASTNRLAIVGSRRCTRYGSRQSRAFARVLAESGVLVVSGLARGIDTEAHWGAVDGGGVTWAVLASGVDTIYPPENRALVERMIGIGGVIMSEFPCGVPPLAHHFPRRNRILAALGDALLVVEAQKTSGALITARWALDLGREVFVVPGQVDNGFAEGSLGLLRDGARLVTSPDDLASDMGWTLLPGIVGDRSKDAKSGGLDRKDRALLASLDHEPTGLDEIVGKSVDPPGEILTRLLALELGGWVDQSPGMLFARTPAADQLFRSAAEDEFDDSVDESAGDDHGDGHADEQSGPLLQDDR